MINQELINSYVKIINRINFIIINNIEHYAYENYNDFIIDIETSKELTNNLIKILTKYD